MGLGPRQVVAVVHHQVEAQAVPRGRLPRRIADPVEGFRGKGKVAQHVLPATAAGGCGTAAAAFAGELAAAGALAEMIIAAGAIPAGLYAVEALLARRDISRAAREVAEKASEHFRVSLAAVYRRCVTIPLVEALEKIRCEYSVWRALHAEFSGLLR